MSDVLVKRVVKKRKTTQPGLTLSEIKRSHSDQEKKRCSVLITEEMKRGMSFSVVDEGFGMRGKSAWVANAITEFLGAQLPHVNQPWKVMVIQTEVYFKNKKGVRETFQIDEVDWIRAWRAAIDTALFGATLEDPVYMEISVSSVIRSAISWKLGLAKDAPRGAAS